MQRIAMTLVFGLMSLTMLVAIGPAALGADQYCLVKNGQPQATILLADEPKAAAQLAAYELQHHVKLITGAMLPIVSESAEVEGLKIMVGDGLLPRRLGLRANALTEQEYLIRFRPGVILLLGEDKGDYTKVVYDMENLAKCGGFPGDYDERGSLDATYDFLEECCGVRWFNPTELGTAYTPSKTLEVSGTDLRRKPAMRNRNANELGGTYDGAVALWGETDSEYEAWEAVSYPKLRQKYPQGGWSGYEQGRRALERLFLLRMRNGGAPIFANHSLYGYYDRFLEQTWKDRLANAKDDKEREKILAQKAKSFDGDHPEYFAQGYEGQPPQMCYTNPGLIRQVAQDAIRYYAGDMSRRPIWNIQLPAPFPVEPMDNSSFCRCDRCKALYEKSVAAAKASGESGGAHSDYFFTFVNAVARELQKTHPGKEIITLAYGSHRLMPSFRLEPNVLVDYCFTTNRSPWYTKGYNAEMAELQRWSKDRQPLYMWLYDTFPMYGARSGKYHCFPGFFAHTAFNQIREFHQLGVQGIFHCGYGQEVEAYVTFKAMVDPYRDVDDLLQDYFFGIYGPAGQPMRAMYEAMEQTYCDPALRPKDTNISGPEMSWGVLGTAERMAHFQGFLDQAKALAETDLQKQRIAAFEHGTWSYMTTGRQNYVDRMKAPIPSVTAPKVASAGGDPAKVDWSKAAALPGPWYERGGDRPTKRSYAARTLHDGEYLYLELTDTVEVGKLVVSPMIAMCDDWEVFLAKQRAWPYRQYLSGPSGLSQCITWGEINFRGLVPIDDSGFKVVSDTSSGTQWVTRMILPLKTILPGGVNPGETIYLNVIRVTSPAVGGVGPCGIDSWVSFCTVHEVDRLGELTLAP